MNTFVDAGSDHQTYGQYELGKHKELLVHNLLAVEEEDMRLLPTYCIAPVVAEAV